MAHEHAPLALAQRCSAVPAPARPILVALQLSIQRRRHAEAPWPGVEMVDAAERTNYPLAMAVDDSGAQASP